MNVKVAERVLLGLLGLGLLIETVGGAVDLDRRLPAGEHEFSSVPEQAGDPYVQAVRRSRIVGTEDDGECLRDRRRSPTGFRSAPVPQWSQRPRSHFKGQNSYPSYWRLP